MSLSRQPTAVVLTK